jgi:hypothetical protein
MCFDVPQTPATRCDQSQPGSLMSADQMFRPVRTRLDSLIGVVSNDPTFVLTPYRHERRTPQFECRRLVTRHDARGMAPAGCSALRNGGSADEQIERAQESQDRPEK